MQDDPREPCEADVPLTECGRNRNYLRVTSGKLLAPSGSPANDAARLVAECLSSTDDTSVFPPRLFILWLTPSYDCLKPEGEPYQVFLDEINRQLELRGLQDTPLIGASVAACFFESGVHDKGAVLVCLASRLIEARCAVAKNAQRDPNEKIAELCASLGISANQEMRPGGNQFLLTFLPGYLENGDPVDYRAGEIFNELRTQMNARLQVFGGVASAGVKPGRGWQFLGSQVYTEAVVAALVDCDITFGIGINHGLKRTQETVHVRDVRENGRTITDFREGTPREVVEKMGELCVFKLETDEDDQVILVPRLVGEHVKLQRSIDNDAELALMLPDKERLQRSVSELEKWVLESAQIPKASVVGLLGIGCVSRYRLRHEIGFDLPAALKSVQRRFPESAFAGCYMDGEIGLDKEGRPCLSNWSISEVFFADDVPPKSNLFIGFRALAQHTNDAMTAPSVHDAITQCLKCIDAAGYRGAMVSLVLDHGKQKIIVAQDAVGEKWKSIVVPATRRELTGTDILAKVASERSPQFVRDAQDKSSQSDAATARRAGVYSFYACPLIDQRVGADNTIGIVQIDLGDMRRIQSIPKEQEVLLKALGAMTAGAISRAIHIEELQHVRALDELLIRSMREEMVDSAIDTFIRGACALLRLEGYVCLLRPGSTSVLRVVAGFGDIYEALFNTRKNIDVRDHNDPSPIAHTFQTVESVVVNDAEHDRARLEMLARFPDGALNTAFQRIKGYACYPICEPKATPIGVVGFISREPRVFSQSKCRSLMDIGHRLSVLEMHVRQKHERQQILARQQFLAETAPSLEDGLYLYDALQRQSEIMRRAARADVVSWFLWDDDRKRYVLRANSGWENHKWNNAAWFGEGEGVTGRIALGGVAQYVSDLQEEEVQYGNDKYLLQMFGDSVLAKRLCEVIVLPLHFKDKPLGVVTLHRLRPRGSESGFAAKDEETIAKAAAFLSAFVAALIEYDSTKWHEAELQRQNDVVKALLSVEPGADRDTVVSTFSDSVIKIYGWQLCAVYFYDSDRRELRLNNVKPDDVSEDIIRQSIAGDDAAWDAFQRRKTKQVRSPIATDYNDPKQVRSELIVCRVCIPIEVDGETVGVLELRWRGTRPRGNSKYLPHHSLQDLQLLSRHLEDALRTQGLQRMRDEARASAERARRTSSGVAQMLEDNLHEFSKGVYAISLVVGWLLLRNLSPEDRGKLDEARQHAQELTELLSRAREVGCRLRARRASCQLDKLLDEAVQRFIPIATRAGIELVPELVPIEGNIDDVSITKSICNLIENAIAATAEGGRVIVELRRAEEDMCVVTIRDNGRGMDLADLKAYLRGEGRDGKRGRTSFGLFLSNLYIERQDGWIVPRTAVGEGTTMEVWLRLRELEGPATCVSGSVPC